MTSQINRHLYNTTEVSKILRISRWTVMSLCRSGALRASRVAETWRISEEAIAEFLRDTEPDTASKSAAPRQRKRRVS